VLPVDSAPTPTQRPEPDAHEDGDRVSVTDVHGTVAHFEMSYSPPSRSGASAKFGPPWKTRIPSALYLLAALVLGGVVLYAYAWAPSNSSVFDWVVEGDRHRPISANVLTIVILVSAAATVLRTHMRGVLVSREWIEARYLLPLGIPRARRWGWPQVQRVIVDGTRIGFELRDGSFERLPEVAKPRELVQLIGSYAQHMRIDVTLLPPARSSPATRR
jgi:hypothetical protein